jgi:hypothetical protein
MSKAVSDTTSCHKQNGEQFSFVPLYNYCCILAYCLSYYKCANKWVHKFCTAVVPHRILNWKTSELIKDSNFYGASIILLVMATPQLFCVHTHWAQHIRYNSSKRVISMTQRSLSDNTQHSQQIGRLPCLRWESNPNSHQASRRRT